MILQIRDVVMIQGDEVIALSNDCLYSYESSSYGRGDSCNEGNLHIRCFIYPCKTEKGEEGYHLSRNLSR
jgi:hypothetical protein